MAEGDESFSSFNINSSEVNEEKWIHKYISGNISALNDWLSSKHFIFQFPNCILRAMGQPIFINNPISGLFILVGMFIGKWQSGLNGLIGLLSALVTACLFKQNKDNIISGSVTFHGLLIGIVLGATYDTYFIMLISCILGILSVPVATGLGNIAGKLGIPAFNFPFNILTFVFIASVGLRNEHFPTPPPPSIGPDPDPYDYKWDLMFKAIPNSLAQIYGSNCYVSGILILIGVLICSPCFFIHAILAAIIGVITSYAIYIPVNDIETGVSTFNAVLSTMCIGGFFYTPSLASSFLALASAMFSTIIWMAMVSMYGKIGVPPLAIPFNISAGILVAATCEFQVLKRVPMDKLTYPENHWKLFRESSRPVNEVTNTNPNYVTF